MQESPSTEISGLLAEFGTLTTFDQVSSWDERAVIVIEKVVETTKQIENQLDTLSTQLNTANEARNTKSFLNRMFSGGEEKKITAEITKLEEIRNRWETIADQLQEKIDTTPNNPQEQKALLKELRLRK